MPTVLSWNGAALAAAVAVFFLLLLHKIEGIRELIVHPARQRSTSRGLSRKAWTRLGEAVARTVACAAIAYILVASALLGLVMYDGISTAERYWISLAAPVIAGLMIGVIEDEGRGFSRPTGGQLAATSAGKWDFVIQRWRTITCAIVHMREGQRECDAYFNHCWHRRVGRHVEATADLLVIAVGDLIEVLHDKVCNNRTIPDGIRRPRKAMAEAIVREVWPRGGYPKTVEGMHKSLRRKKLL